MSERVIQRAAVSRSERWALLAIVLLQIFIGLYGINAPVQWGHQGYHIAEHGLGARNLLRHGVWQHSIHFQRDAPPPGARNFHHVTMAHPYIALVQSIFGEAPWTARVHTLFFSLVAILLLWWFVRNTRGPFAAWLAAILFVISPIHVSFCNLPDIEIISIAAIIAVCLVAWDMCEWGPSWWRIVALWIAVLWGAAHDWPFYPAVGFVLGCAFWEITLSKNYAVWSKSNRRRTQLALSIALLIPFVIAGQHLWRATRAGALRELFDSATQRSASSVWDDFGSALMERFSFFYLLPVVGLVLAWLFWCIVRGRADRALRFVAAVLLGQTLWLMIFRNEFVVHEYRSYWFLFPFVFVAVDGIMAATKTFSLPHSARALRLAPALTLLVAWGARSIEVLPLSRATAGSFFLADYAPQHETMMAARVASTLAADGRDVFVHHLVEPRLEVYWLIDGKQIHVIRSAFPVRALLRRGKPAVVIQKKSVLSSHSSWRKLAQQARVLVIGKVAILDLRADRLPSLEGAKIVWPTNSGLVDQWLYAPVTGLPQLVPKKIATSDRILRYIGTSAAQSSSTNASASPLLAELPRTWLH